MEKSDANNAEDAGENRQSLATTWRQFRTMVHAFFKSERRRKAYYFLISLLALTLTMGWVQKRMSFALKDFMDAITQRDFNGYWPTLRWYLVAIALAIPIGTFSRFVEDRFALFWREWMTQHLMKRYFNNRAYYRLRGTEGVDNPDQRISEDIRNFTTSSLSFMLIALQSVITVCVFIDVLWGISLSLVGVLLVYALGGTAISVLIARRLVRLHYKQYAKEADFRYALVRVRDNAESIAFYRGEKREHLGLFNRLTAAVENLRKVIVTNRHLAFFTNSYNYIGALVPTLMVAPMYMRGEVGFGTVAQAGGAFAQVLAAVSLIITQFGMLSAYLAGVQRLGSLWEQLDEHDAEEQRIAAEAENVPEEDSRCVHLENLDIVTPDRLRVLVKELTFALTQKQSIIVMGPSGTGKSSVLRTIAGLWPGGGGTLERPAFDQLMFLPQRPYMVEGSLRNQLLYPYPEQGKSDDEIREVVDEVNLSDIIDRVDSDLDRVVDWGNILSLGEQQRVAFARLFLRKPKFAFLDEATSALDEANQAELYEKIKEAKIGFISVGHRTALVPFHDRILMLSKDGSWTLQKTSEWLEEQAAAQV